MAKSGIRKKPNPIVGIGAWAAGALALLAVACTAESAAPVTEVPPTPTAVSALPTASPEVFPTMQGLPGGGPCTHRLWPLWDGGQWVYQWEGSDWPPATLSAAVQDASATATLTWGDASGTLRCTDEGFIGLPTLLVVHPDLGAGLVGEPLDGMFLPPPGELLPMGIETTWDAEYTLSGTLDLPSPTGAIPAVLESGRLVLVSRTLPPEAAVLPFGQVTALPVEQSTFIEAQIMLPGGALCGITVDALTYLYFAEEIGLVRVRYEGGTIAGLPQGGVGLLGNLALARSVP